MMRRDHCIAALYPHIAEDVMISVYSSAWDWLRLRPNHPLNYNSVGAMGLASSHGLGLALARPDRRIVVLDGDGSLLMNIGTLVTVADVAPPNLYHFVVVNGTYEANGSHPIPGKDKLSFAGMARAAGYQKVYSFSDLADFEAKIGGIVTEPGPVFVELKVVPGDIFEPGPADYAGLYSNESREEFKRVFMAD